MPSDNSNEVVVITQDETGKPVANTVEVANPSEPESIVEEIFDAILDPFGSDSDSTDAATAPMGVVEPVMVVEPVIVSPETEGEWTTSDASDLVDPSATETVPGGETTDVAAADAAATHAETATDTTPDTDTAPAGDTELATDTSPATDPESASDTQPAADPAGAEAQAHADAATDLQDKADAAVDSGDYAAAADLRGSAEDEAWQAGDSDMLHGEDSIHLESADAEQQTAAEYEQDEAKDAAAGDYEAARDDASHAANATGDADMNARGADHTG